MPACVPSTLFDIQASAVTTEWVSATGGSWTTASNWSTSPYYPQNDTPLGTTYDVVISGASSGRTISVSKSVTVNSITALGATTLLSVGTMRALNGISIQAPCWIPVGTLSQTVVSGTGVLQVGLSGTPYPVLDAITLASTAALTRQGTLTITNGLTLQNGAITGPDNAGTERVLFSGDQTLSGSGRISSGNWRGSSAAAGTLTVGSGITFQAQPTLSTTLSATGAGSVINRGQVVGNISTGTLSIAGSFVNAGTLTVSNGGALYLNATSGWTNQGTVKIEPNNALVLTGSDIEHLNLGNIERTGARVQIGGTYNNTGSTLYTNDFGGGWTAGWPHVLRSGSNGPYSRIVGGIIAAAGGVESFDLEGYSVFDGVQIDCDVIVPHSHAYFVNGLKLNGTVHLKNDDLAWFQVGPGTTLSGSGTLSFDGTNYGFLMLGGRSDVYPYYGEPTVVAPGITIKTGTSSGLIGGEFTNRGTVSAATPKQVLTLRQCLNEGVIEARNGGVIDFSLPLNLNNRVLTGGKWRVSSGSSIDSDYPVLTNAADVTLSGPGSSFSVMDSITTNTGRLNITDGRDFSTQSAISNSGTLVVGVASDLIVNGDLIQANNASLSFEIQDQSNDEGFGQLFVAQVAALSGNLQVTFRGYPNVKPGDTVTILTAGQVSGVFDSVTLPLGSTADVIYSPTSVSLHFTLVPEPPGAALLAPAFTALLRRRRPIRGT